MKKMNKRGFLLAETIGISVVVIVSLVIIYTQFISVNNSYYRTYNYNNVNDLYLANQIKQLINNDAASLYDSINEENLYVDITDCSDFVEYMYCERLMDAIDAKKVIVTKNDITQLSNNINNYDFSETMKKYIKSSKSNDDGYRLIIEFNDDTIAGLKMGGSTPVEPIICGYEIGKTWEFVYTGDIQEFDVPCTGTYKLEVYGSQGASAGGTGGKGGYSYGNASLKATDILYVVAGGRPYNGGGTSSTGNADGASGGGATHIATMTGLLSELENNKDSILIVAGGGGGGAQVGDTDPSVEANGGAGGGETGKTGGKNATGEGDGTGGTGGTQLEGYAFGQGQNGSGGNNYTGLGAGGGGWYGGYKGKDGSDFISCGGGGGGSGYIGGVTNGQTIDGSQSIPSPTDGSVYITGNSGTGYAKITLVSLGDEIPNTQYAATQEIKTYSATKSCENLCDCSCGGGNGAGHCEWHESQGEEVDWWEDCSYKCTQGGTLSGTTCSLTIYTCPQGGTLFGTMCVF